jgi:RNA-splicing ligase RtcB
MILRKGAVSAKLGEKLIIPMNMRDGSLICEGLGNPDWNYSAPHGAGRVMSRKKAFAELKMEDYENAMAGVYSTSVTKETIDESPFAYKKIEDIISNVKPSVNILAIIKPIYNFKAVEEQINWKEKKLGKRPNFA